MSDIDADEIRRELRAVAEEFARIEQLRRRRGELIEDARAASMTVREVAQLLGMTERGVDKAQSSYRRSRDAAALAS